MENKVQHSINNRFINNGKVFIKTKINTLRYACESWILTRQQKSKIQAAQMKYLRRIKGITKKDKIKNEDIRQAIGAQSIPEFIEQRKLNCGGCTYKG